MHASPRVAFQGELGVQHVLDGVVAQCRNFFARHDWLVSTPHADTAGAARDVAPSGLVTRGAVASDMAAVRYGLDIIASRIEDVPANWTRFVAVSLRDA